MMTYFNCQGTITGFDSNGRVMTTESHSPAFKHGRGTRPSATISYNSDKKVKQLAKRKSASR